MGVVESNGSSQYVEDSRAAKGLTLVNSVFYWTKKEG